MEEEEVYVANQQPKGRMPIQQEEVYVNYHVLSMDGQSRLGPDGEGESCPIPALAPAQQQMPQNVGGSKGPKSNTGGAKGPKGSGPEKGGKEKGGQGLDQQESFGPPPIKKQATAPPNYLDSLHEGSATEPKAEAHWWASPNMLKAVPMTKGGKQKGTMGGNWTQGKMENPLEQGQNQGWKPPTPKFGKGKKMLAGNLAPECLKAPTIFIPTQEGKNYWVGEKGQFYETVQPGDPKGKNPLAQVDGITGHPDEPRYLEQPKGKGRFKTDKGENVTKSGKFGGYENKKGHPTQEMDKSKGKKKRSETRVLYPRGGGDAAG